MTDPTPTTNEEIALELGWTQHELQDEGLFWFRPGCEIFNRDTARVCVPDYEHEWAHAGALLEELIRAEVICEGTPAHLVDKQTGPEGIWFIELRNPSTCLRCDYEGDTLPEAISCAWLAWKKEE